MIDSNREEFEKLPEIAKNIDKYIFCEVDNKYKELDIRYALGRIKINGAWYAFQEQQKKLDCCREENKAHLEKINELQSKVDGAIKILDGMRHNGAYRAIDILKGNKDETGFN